MKAAILDIRHLALPKMASVETGRAQQTTLVVLRLFGLDRAPARRCLVCHWHRDADGKLVAPWALDIDPAIARIHA
jgi:hypothetical protein